MPRGSRKRTPTATPTPSVLTPTLLAPYYTRLQLAKDLGCSERTLRRLQLRGEGPPSFKLAGEILYHRASVEAWLLESASNAASGRKGPRSVRRFRTAGARRRHA